MLVLQRELGEVIVIGTGANAIRIMPLKINGGGKKAKIRIGIEAPKDVPVHRLEIRELLDQQAAGASKDASLACGKEG